MCLTILRKIEVPFDEVAPSVPVIKKTLEKYFEEVLDDLGIEIDGKHSGVIKVDREPISVYARISGFYYAIRVVRKRVDPKTKHPVWLLEVTRRIWE